MLNSHQQRVWGDEPGGHRANQTGFYPDARQFAHDTWVNVFPDKVFLSPAGFAGNGAASNNAASDVSKWTFAPTAANHFPGSVLMKSVEPLEDYDPSELLPLPNAVAPSTIEIMRALNNRSKRHLERQQEMHIMHNEAQMLMAQQAQPTTDPEPEPDQGQGATAGSTESGQTDASSECHDDSEGQLAAPEPVPPAAPEPEPEETRLVLPALETLIAMRKRRLNPNPKADVSVNQKQLPQQPQPPSQRSGGNADRTGWDGAAKGSERRPGPVRRVVVVATYAAPRASTTEVPSIDGPTPATSSALSFSAARGLGAATSPTGPQPPTAPPIPGVSWRASRKWGAATDSTPTTNPAAATATTISASASNQDAVATCTLASVPSAPTSTRPAPPARAPGPSWAGNEHGRSSSVNMALSRSFTFGHKQTVCPPTNPPQGSLRPPQVAGTGPGLSLPPAIGVGSELGLGPEGQGLHNSRVSLGASESRSSVVATDEAAVSALSLHSQQQQQQQRQHLEQWQQHRRGGGGGAAVAGAAGGLLSIDGVGGDNEYDDDDDEDDFDDRGGGDDEDDDGEDDGEGCPAVAAAAARGGKLVPSNSRHRSSHEEDKATWRRARRITQSFDVAGMDGLALGQGPSLSPCSAPSSSTGPLHGMASTGQVLGRSQGQLLAAPAAQTTAPLSPMASRRGGGGGGGATEAASRSAVGSLALPTWLDKALGRSRKRNGGSGPSGDDAAEAIGRIASSSTATARTAAAPAAAGGGGGGGLTSKFKSFKNRLHGGFSSTVVSPSGDSSASISPTALAGSGGPRVRLAGSNDGRSAFVGPAPGGGAGRGGGELPPYGHVASRGSLDSSVKTMGQQPLQQAVGSVGGVAMRNGARTAPGSSASTAAAVDPRVGSQSRSRFPIEFQPQQQQAGGPDLQNMVVVAFNSLDRRRGEPVGGWAAVPPVQLPPVRML